MMGLSELYAPKIAEAVTSAAKRPSVVWLHFSECTGCSEMFIKAVNPSPAELILDILSIDYHETIMAAGGEQAEENLKKAVEAGGFVLVVEGGIPQTPGYGQVGGRDMFEILKTTAAKAVGVIALGACATHGGIPAANPNPAKITGVSGILGGTPVVNLPGCPSDPKLLVATVMNFLLFGKLPDLDAEGRPKMFFSKTIHEQCERRSYFEAGKFVENFGTPEMEAGYCLYKMGCKGPQTKAPCATMRYNNNTSWCINAGAPCIGCMDLKFPDAFHPFYAKLKGIHIPGFGGDASADNIGKVLGVATAAGVAVHAAGTAVKASSKKGGEE
jgi:hydrogenase small subunit/[NiFe] hydrogenase small subunit